MSIERLEPAEPEQQTDAIIFEFPGIAGHKVQANTEKVESSDPIRSMSSEEICKWLSYLNTGIKNW